MKLSHLLVGKNSKSTMQAKAVLHQVARDPYLDWVIIFFISLLAAIGLALGGIFTFFNLESQLSAADASQPPPSAIIDTKALSATLGQFDGRAAARSDLLRGYSGSSDPSL